MLTTELSTFKEFEFDNQNIPMITIYNKPTDFPNKFVARLFYTNGPTEFAVIKDTLQEIRESIPENMIALPRFKEDDPYIVEVYV